MTALAERPSIGADPSPSVRLIRSDREAIGIADELAVHLEAAGKAGSTSAALRSSGLLGIVVPKRFGGFRASAATQADVLRRLAAADPRVADLLQAHFVAARILFAASDLPQAAAFADLILDGDRFVAVLRGSAGAVRLVGNGDGRRLEGRSGAIADIDDAQWLVIEALSDDGAATAVVVAADAPGIVPVAEPQAIDQREGGFVHLLIDMPAGGGVIGDGRHPRLPLPDGEGLGLLLSGAILLGIADAALRDAARFVTDHARPWFEAGVERAGDEPGVILAAGLVAVEHDAAAALHARALRLFDDGADPALAAALTEEARAFAGEVALAAGSALFDAGGTSSADDRWDHGRHWRAARARTARRPVRQGYLRAGRAAIGRAAAQPAPPARSVVEADTVPILSSFDEAVDLARHFADRFAVTAAARDRQRAHPRDELRTLARSGLLGIGVPVDHGGGFGASRSQTFEISRILSRADGSIGQILTVHYGFVSAIGRAASPAQRDVFYRAALTGARFGNATAERGTAHAKIFTTRLTSQSDGSYRLSGGKYYSTGALDADWISVLAADDQGRALSVLVPRDAPGLTVEDDWSALGQRATASGTARFDDIAVSADQVLDPWLIGDRFTTATSAANIGHIAIDVGIAEAALADTIALIAESADAEDGFVLHRIGQLSARIHAAGELLERVGAHLERLSDEELTEEATQTLSLDVSRAKVFAGELAIEAGSALFDLAGEAAIGLDDGFDRHWRNARTHTLHDPSRWRYYRAGDHLLNGRLPPKNRSS